MIALVTGGRRGIGLAIVKALKQAGYKVAVVAESKDAPDCDLYIQQSLIMSTASIVPRVVSELGGLDIVVNNAGIQVHAPLREYDVHQFKAQQSLMVTSAFEISQAAAGFMDKGHIINILSTAAFQGARNIVGYVTAKHALLGMTRALAVELAPDIHVNAIAPGLIDTDMTAEMSTERKQLLNSITPAGRFGTPEDIADAVMYLIESKYIYGETMFVDGGWMVKNG